ncbi:hypothetical protein [Variovorax sp. 38R]|uniref:hypothetical protein n=1 Tax=Variovorax sp. 38R TaxID=2774875 RepID=UPI001785932C|nr:hypothetical protein [Variovorax sp. 38R]QOF76101.1 hypothetical protein IG196_16980 [Variovorax sp. 38R]
MSAVTHEFPRAYEAAKTVDPLLLAQALDHIARSAAKSRSQTRRIRWIEQRALIALRGDKYRDIDLDLPKSAGPDTPEKLQRRMAYHIALRHELLAAYEEAIEALRGGDPIARRYALRAAADVVAKARGDVQ